MSESYMARLGARLVDNGYPVLPIMPGTKKPGQFKGGAWRDYRGWTKHGTRPTSEHELAIWNGWPDAGIGIATGTVIGVDIDIRDDQVASRLEQLARKVLGDTPAVRFGLPPKRLLVYRTAEPLSGMKAHPIEVLGLGQQFVAFADHPGYKASLPLAAGVAGRSAGRERCRWSTERCCGRSWIRRRGWCRRSSGQAGCRARPQHLRNASALAICVARQKRSPRRSGSFPTPTSTTTAGSASAWRSRARSATKAGICSPPGPQPPARTCPSSPQRPGPASSPSASAPAPSITTPSPAAGRPTRR